MNGDTRAAVVTSPPPTTVPHKERYFDRVDENNPEYLRERNMAPDLRQDFNMMEQKKRVSMILQSPAFCEELESMIQEQFKKGKNPTGLLALQQIADFMTANVPNVYPAAPQGGMAALNMSLGMVTPVNDLRGSDSIAYDKGEKLLRCKLAALYRLADLFGWSQLIYNHITTRVSSEQEHFLIVPFGLLYSEVTASSLVKINLQGDVVDRGSTNLGVNQAGFTLHSAIYAARPDVKCVVHIHTPAGAAVSAMKCGLLPISPEALSLGEVAYHDYHGILVDEEEKVLIQKNLGPKSKVLILRNHGLVSAGESVEEAFYYIHNLVVACEIQVRTLASAGGPDNLVLLDPEKYKAKSRPAGSPAAEGSGSTPQWQIGEQEFEALMRMLDNLLDRLDAVVSLTVVTILTFQLFLILQWTKEDGHRTSTSAVPNLFVPLNTNPKEVQEMRNKIREQNLQDIKTAGPQSQVLCGVVMDRSLVQDAPLSDCTETIEGLERTEQAFSPARALSFRKFREDTGPSQRRSDFSVAQAIVRPEAILAAFWTSLQGELVTASKAIIEKEYQPHVIVSTTGPNPFNTLTDRELEEYRREVERKQKGPEESLDETGEQKEKSPPEPPAAPHTPPSTPVQLEEDSLLCFLFLWLRHKQEVDVLKSTCYHNPPQEPTPRDDSDAATFQPPLPDLSPDEPSEALGFPTLEEEEEEEEEGLCEAGGPPSPTGSPTEASPEPATAPAAEEGAAVDPGSDGSPGKSPSKKKKKFRTPSFLKKSKTRSGS
ncbi:Alpha-adducin [Camelus dromedarius]|uniref:Alpha-adducin n=1 Tax=Camelus dromedarius TaxID=9838 RepID=A0A5N4EEV6_CAMDR|nr:Alpha-adducin [Camelus dromedarius]